MVVLVFYREGLGLASSGETFSNRERGEDGGCAFQHERPVQAHIIRCHARRHVGWRVQEKRPGCDVREIFQAGDLIVYDGH